MTHSTTNYTDSTFIEVTSMHRLVVTLASLRAGLCNKGVRESVIVRQCTPLLDLFSSLLCPSQLTAAILICGGAENVRDR